MLRKLLGLDPSHEIDQIDLAFRGGWFLALVLAAAAIGFAIFLYRAGPELPRKRRLLMMAAQALALLTFLMIVLQPYARIRTTRESRRTMLILLDTSRSMAIDDPRRSPDEIAEAAMALDKLPLDQTLRADEAERLRPSLGSTRRLDLARAALSHPGIALLDQLAANYDVRFFTFDSELRPVAEPRAGASNPPAADGSSSQLGSALDEAVGRYAGQPLAGAIVLSDFAWVEGKDPLRVAHRLQERGIPVYPVPIGLPAPPDIQVRSVVAPEVVFKGDRVPLRVKIESRGYDGRQVDLQLRIDGQESASRPVELKDGVQFAEMMFIPQRESGTITLDFAIAAVAGEITAANNTATHKVRILDEKIKVLYIEGMPRWEYRYLRWVLLRDPRLEVQFLMTQGDPALAATSPQHLGRFPQDARDALKYDLIILGDVPASYFNTAQTDLIEQLVKERGGSLLMIAGPMAAPATYRDTPLGDLLPVTLGAGASHPVAADVSPEVTAAGHASLATSLSLAPETSARIWSHVKPMDALPPLSGAKPGATVLLRLPKESEEIPDYPLVAWHRAGTGKCLFVATEDLWRMRLEVGERYHARFWGQTIQFLTLSRLLGQNKQVNLETDRGRYSAGEQIRLFANVLTESFEPVRQSSYEVVLEREGEADAAIVIELEPVSDTPGLYTGSHLAGPDGSYLLRTQSQDAGISNQTAFEVVTEPLEDRETAMQPGIARQLAELSGGRELTLAGLAAFPASLPAEEKLTSVVRFERDLWDGPLWFLLVAGFAGVEWYLRRKYNLV